MALLDEKDVVIIEQLLKDARTPLTAIAKKADLSVTAVKRRIDNLEKNKIIRSYKLVLNHPSFDVEEYDIYYKLTNVSEFTINYCIKYLSKSPFVTQVLSTIGFSDLRVTALAKNGEHLSRLLTEVESNFSHHISDRIIVLVRKKYKAKSTNFFKSILGKHHDKKKATKLYEETQTSLDDLDKQIIRLLSKNPRVSYSEIAEKTNVSSETISNRVNQLIRNKIILGFATLLNGEKLGFRWSVMLVKLRSLNDTQRQKVIDQILSHPNVSSAVDLFGEYDFSITNFGRTLDELRSNELDFRSWFAEQAIDTKILFVLEHAKYPELAEGILDFK